MARTAVTHPTAIVPLATRCRVRRCVMRAAWVLHEAAILRGWCGYAFTAPSTEATMLVTDHFQRRDTR